MVNTSRGNRGRFTSHAVNNSSSAPAQPKERLDHNSSSNKKRRLNDGTSQNAASVPSEPIPINVEPTPPTSLPHRTQPARRATPATSRDRTPRADITPSKTDDKRTLRSQDVTRRRSELVNFFADFETVVFGPDRPDDNLHPDTKLLITTKIPHSSILQRLDDDIPTPSSAIRPEQTPLQRPQPLANNALTHEARNLKSVKQPSGPLFRKIKLPARRKNFRHTQHDPLSDDLYDAAHKRGERKEKQSRNWDKERAMYEKGELERLLKELKGAEWLKLMGIAGASETDVKRFKFKRNIFIARAQSMLERYKAWNKRDRELKLEREQRLAEEEDSSSEEDQSERSSRSSSAHPRKPSSTRRNAKARDRERSLQPAVEKKAFESFFEKPHMREAAMKSHRRGRHILAFGLPVFEMEPREFRLPPDVDAAGISATH